MATLKSLTFFGKNRMNTVPLKLTFGKIKSSTICYIIDEVEFPYTDYVFILAYDGDIMEQIDGSLSNYKKKIAYGRVDSYKYEIIKMVHEQYSNNLPYLNNVLTFVIELILEETRDTKDSLYFFSNCFFPLIDLFKKQISDIEKQSTENNINYEKRIENLIMKYKNDIFVITTENENRFETLRNDFIAKIKNIEADYEKMQKQTKEKLDTTDTTDTTDAKNECVNQQTIALQDHIKNLEEEINYLKQEINDLEYEIDDLEKDVEELEKENTSLKYQITELEGEIDDLEEENKDLEKKNTNLEKDVEELEDENTDMENRITELEEDVKELEEENTSLKYQIEGENDDLEEENTYLKEENTGLKKQNTDLQKQITEEKIAVTFSNSEITNLKHDITDLENQIKYYEETILSLREMLDKEMEFYATERPKYQQQINHLTNELNIAHGKLEDVKSTVTNNNEIIKEQEQKLVIHEEKNNTVKEFISQLEIEMEVLLKKIDDLNAQNKKTEDCNRTLICTNHDLEKNNKKLTNDVLSLELESKEMLEKINKLQKERDELEKRLEESSKKDEKILCLENHLTCSNEQLHKCETEKINILTDKQNLLEKIEIFKIENQSLVSSVNTEKSIIKQLEKEKEKLILENKKTEDIIKKLQTDYLNIIDEKEDQEQNFKELENLFSITNKELENTQDINKKLENCIYTHEKTIGQWKVIYNELTKQNNDIIAELEEKNKENQFVIENLKNDLEKSQKNIKEIENNNKLTIDNQLIKIAELELELKNNKSFIRSFEEQLGNLNKENNLLTNTINSLKDQVEQRCAEILNLKLKNNESEKQIEKYKIKYNDLMDSLKKIAVSAEQYKTNKENEIKILTDKLNEHNIIF